MPVPHRQSDRQPAPPRDREGGAPSRNLAPHHPKWHQRLAALLIYTAIRCLSVTIRFRLGGESCFFREMPPEKMIFTIWHNRLVLALMIYHRYVIRRDRHRKLAAVVSASRDGGLLTRILQYFAVEPVRGSSSRRAAPALRELIAWGERGYDLAITPDGPRGPRYTVPEGVIATAQLTGLRIVPVAYRLNWKICIKSWDRLQIPLPFACCEITTGRILQVPATASEVEREDLRRQLEAELRAITRD